MNQFTNIVFRHPVSKKPILNAPVCVDDFGSMVFICQYTKALVWIENAIFIGSCMPNVHGTCVCAPDAMEAFKASKAAFNENDANCNTCKHLQRVPHEKSRGGFLYGKCGKGIVEHQYPVKDGIIMFHPDDPMLRECWSPRA